MKPTAAALLLLALLSLVLTQPLALHLGTAVEDRQDALLNVWITAWDEHQLMSDPWHLFDANIFHPYPRTLAYSELLLGNALLALPLTCASGNPVLGYNLALLLSFVLTGLGTYLLVRRLTGSPWAGLLAGVVFAFCSYRMSNLAQAQLLTTQWMPLALLSFHQAVCHPRARHIATFVLFFSLQAVSSFYYGMILAIAVVILGAGTWLWDLLSRRKCRSVAPSGRLPGEGPGPAAVARPWSGIVYLLVAVGLLLLILLPFALPYFQVQREMGFERGLAESEPFSASLRQYAAVPPGSLLHSIWLPSEQAPQPGGYAVDALFPTLTALALALVGLVVGRGRSRWLFLCLLVTAFVLSLGPRLYLAPGRPSALEMPLPYAWLYAILPGFRALRAPVRFDALVMLSLAVLTGYGVAALERLSRSRSRGPARLGWRAAWLPGLLALLILESVVWPAAHAERVPVGREVPPVYRWLAGQPPGVLLELPMAFTAGGPQLDYQYLSTYHWHTTPDGYSGFVPPKHGQIVYEMERFPSERSVSLLQALGVQYVVIHAGRYGLDRWRRIEAGLGQCSDLNPVVTFGQDRVFQVRGRSISPEGLQVSAYLPPQAVTGEPYPAFLIVLNPGERSYAISPTRVTRPTATWKAAGATEQAGVSADVPLVTSPHGGAAVIPLELTAPSLAGGYSLAIAEADGPLGRWRVEGTVTVAEAGAGSATSFPVPAQLVAWRVPSRARPGELLQVELTWRALGKIDAYYSVYVKLLDADGKAVVGWDGEPRQGQAPTLLWVPGETIDDTVTLHLPPDTAPGDYWAEVGMYRAADLARVLTLDDQGRPLDRVLLGKVHVEP